MIKKICVVWMMCMVSIYGIAEESNKDKQGPNYLLTFILLEGLVVLNSKQAAKSPRGYGAASALLFPIGAGFDDEYKYTSWVTLIAVESVALYNLTLDEANYTEKEIYKNNMKAWHMLMGVMLTSHFIESTWINNKNVKFFPAQGGGQIELTYKF